MTATCSSARGPVNSAFHEAVKISFLMSDIRSLSTYLTCPAWCSWLGPGWVHLDDEFVYFPALVLELPSGTRHSSRYQQLSSPPPSTPIGVLAPLKLARLVRPISVRNSPDNSFTGFYRGGPLKSERETALAV